MQLRMRGAMNTLRRIPPLRYDVLAVITNRLVFGVNIFYILPKFQYFFRNGLINIRFFFFERFLHVH